MCSIKVETTSIPLLVNVVTYLLLLHCLSRVADALVTLCVFAYFNLLCIGCVVT